MKISQVFNLNKSQYELDFVDIDPTGDLPLFIDPYFLAQRADSWSINASRTVRSFFQHLVTLLANDQIDDARGIFQHLGEPKETFLGLSSGEPQGRGIGSIDADKIFDSLLESKAVETGLVEDLEDCRIFVDGIDKDKLSDLTTNIIRHHLIEYTVQQCNLWGIPFALNVPSGFFWNREELEWQNTYTNMLVIDDRKILLVPKAITSFRLGYTPQKYHQHFVLNFLQHEHLRLNSALVRHRRRRDGTETSYVTKKDIRITEAPPNKEFLRRFTQAHPEVFQDFKTRTAQTLESPKNEEFGAPDIEEVIDHLLERLRAIPAGPHSATQYHRLVVGILELVFYPKLTCPQVEREIHEGRKRIDITFDNAAQHGFFHRLHTVYRTPAQFIFVECKNYSDDPENPQLDQLSGRFSLNRGKFGLLLCRTIENIDLFLSRCSDTYRDDRGMIIPLVDADLVEMLEAVRRKNDERIETILYDKFRGIALH
jgi:hypothetical protein